MNAYTYPPDKNLLREKLNRIHHSETQLAWTKFEHYWLMQRPVETPVKKHFRFVGIPLPLILRGFFACALVLISISLYKTANSKLPPVLQEVRSNLQKPVSNPAQAGKAVNSKSAAQSHISSKHQEALPKNKRM